MDVHVRHHVSAGLRQRGVDVLTSQEDSTTTLSDAELLDRATLLERVIVTQDEDFLAEAARRQSVGDRFAGIAYAHQMMISIGQLVRDLDLMSQVYDPSDMENRVEHLPL